ncbi:PEPxxWA-CTERM sorting domain-containing protein [Sphingopyxis sp.]|uniref:Npun_F0296 family exosortase-dependent surface protein n=1 Tax=Sphingopyxis sp. TaxID=1908224 RepID=UPI0025F5D7B2|nr:PEPxxWA-CTERM sorting domain-containing protein [Sphingopyxis sp.]
MRTLMIKLVLASAAAMALPAAAHAAVTLGSVTPGTSPYSGPTPTIDFETPAPVSGGLVTTGSLNGVRAQPFGSTGNYWTVGPSDGSPGVMDLSSFGDILNISFLWGSVDEYNSIDFLDGDDNVIATFSGSDIFNPANGDQTDPNLNPVVRFDVTGEHVASLTSLRLRSTNNAFETDNFAINAVPEPATWAMMLLGFGAIGFGMRRRRSDTVRVRFA